METAKWCGILHVDIVKYSRADIMIVEINVNTVDVIEKLMNKNMKHEWSYVSKVADLNNLASIINSVQHKPKTLLAGRHKQ